MAIRIKKISNETKIEAVCAILNGELFLEEAMERYHILQKVTIVNWIKKFLPDAKKRMEERMPEKFQDRSISGLSWADKEEGK